MFMGEYQHTVDNKGRLIIPAKFREGLGENFVVTKGLDNCLFGYPASEWHSLEEKLRTLPFTRADARAFVRFFFSGATECEIDKQGRILLPNNLREFAGLSKDVVIIGVSSRIEIWSRKAWDEYSTRAETEYDALAEKLKDLDLGI
ncbi:MAG: division/cell wall cluster transcriptional repressor MraZ [Bacillota bacterium]